MALDFLNFQISGKKDNLERLTEMFQTNFRRYSVPFDSELEFPETWGLDFSRYTVGSLNAAVMLVNACVRA